MTVAIQSALQLILMLAGGLTSSAEIKGVINALVTIIPQVAQDAPLMIQIIQNIIASLSGNSATTTAQLQQLKTLDAECDAAFDKAWAAFEATNKPTTS